MKTKLLVLDFDGVMTDGRVLVGFHQEFLKVGEVVQSQPHYTELGVFCHRRDGHGIQLLKESGVEVWCLTAEGDPGANLAAFRCAKLGIPLYSGVKEKGERLLQLLATHHEAIGLEEVAYLGDDVSDLPALKIVGMPCITHDCHPSLRNLRAIRDQNTPGLPKVIQTFMEGGWGAVREVCDTIIQKNLLGTL